MNPQRRSFLTAGGMAMLTMPSLGRATATPVKPRTFVLVHGSWHGGWCWVRVAERLQARGHRVFTPTLTGLADRSHLMSGMISLGTHVDDVVNLFRWYDLDDVVLVAHSYAGWPVAGAIEKLLPRLSAVLFLDAFMPENGDRGLDIASEQNRDAMLAALAKGQISRPPPPAAAFKIQKPADITWVEAKMTDQPIGVSTQPIMLTGARSKVPKKAYIRSGLYPMALFDKWLAGCRAQSDWKTYVIPDSGHDMMIDSPDRLTEILLDAS